MNLTVQQLVRTALRRQQKKFFRGTLTAFLVAMLGVSAHAAAIGSQAHLVSGVVTDQDGSRLPGVNVLLKGTLTGTTTNAEGMYELEVTDPNATLVFSFIGYVSEEVSIASRSALNISMIPETTSLQEVVVIGYGTLQKPNVTSSIARVSGKEFERVQVTSFDQALAGQAAGVNIVQSSGMPGKSPAINIRGVGTITAGSKPLIVVDGLPLSENIESMPINPSNIESVEILKDAAASAIYGSRASNGVILITTRSGGDGKPQFAFNMYYGVQQVTQQLDLMDAYEFASFVKEGRDNYYVSLNPALHQATDDNATRALRSPGNKKVLIPDFVAPYLGNQPGLTNTDWQDAIFRTAPVKNYELTASGGVNKTKFFASANYFDQQGIIVGSGFKRYSMRLNLTTRLIDNLKFGVNISPTVTTQNKVAEGWDDSPVTMAINAMPVFPVYNADGSFAISQQLKAAIPYDMAQVENPLALVKSITNNENQFTLFGGGYLEWDVVNGLKAKTYLGGSYFGSRENYYRPSFVGAYRVPAPTQATAFSATGTIMNWITENTLTYNLHLNEAHHIEVLAGYSYQQETIQRNRITATNFPNDNVRTLSAGQVNGGTSTEEQWALISYLGRVQYNYKDRYLLTAAIRSDGSSRFGPNTKWGSFPSVSAGWRVSEEAFYPTDFVVSDLKARASWGVTGNNQIPNYGSVALLTPANYILGNNPVNGLVPSTAPNPGISWEETSMRDVGIDVGLFKGQLTLTADYYLSRTSGLLLNVPVPAHSGYTSSLRNLGKVENKGVELTLTSKHNIGPVKITASVNYASNQNKVLALGPGQSQIVSGSNITRVGDPVGSHYGYQVLGVFQNQDQLNALPHLATARVGSYIYADLNNDGAITSNDRKITGSFFPDYTFGVSLTLQYKGFDIATLLQGVQGVKVRDQLMGTLLYNAEGWSNASQDLYDNHFRSEANPGGGYAQATPVPTDNLYRTTDLFVNDASFVRFRNISVGYAVPKHVCEKITVNTLRVYVSARNPFTYTKFEGYNPEQTTNDLLQAGTTLGNYPLDRSLIFGINLTF